MPDNIKDNPATGREDPSMLMSSGSGAPHPSVVAIVGFTMLVLVAAFMATRISFNSFAAFIVVVLALVGSYRAPRIALIFFLVYTSSVLAPEFFFLYVDPNLIYWGAELFLLVIVLGAIAQRTREGEGTFSEFFTSPVALALTLLGAVISIKSIVFLVDVKFAQWALSHVYTFNRSLGFLALFVPVYLLFNNGRLQRRFLIALYFIGIFVVVRVMLEAVFPDLYIFEWIGLRQSLSVDFPSVDPSILRLRAPGGSIVQVCFWMGIMNLILRPWTPRRLGIYLPLTMLMLTGILLEFNRSYFVPILGLTGLAMLLNQRAVRAKLLALLAVFVLAVVVLSLATTTVGDYVGAFTERYSSAFSDETSETQSLNSRKIENGYAWDSIRREPVFGIDIDELYRPSVAGMLDNLRWYIHNAYIWYWVYFGIIGLATLVAAISVVTIRGILNWRKIRDPFLQAGVLALVFTLITLSIASFYAPRFYEYGTVPVVAVIMGMIEAIIIADRKVRARGETGEAETLLPPDGVKSADE